MIQHRTITNMSASSLALSALILGFAHPALAQGVDTVELAEDEEARQDVIIVRSTRTDEALGDLSRSARVYDDEDLSELLSQTSSVQEILGKTLPGFASPTTESSAASLTLRGRAPLYLIDGVPLATNTNFSRFLDKFDPLTIGGLEVVYGPTALYGAGATGGVIQFFTADPVDEGFEFVAGSQVRTSLVSDFVFEDDATSYKYYGSGSARLNDFISVYGFASFDDTNGLVRSEGDLLYGGRSDFVEDVTLFGKVKVDFTPSQTLTITANDTELKSSDRQFELTRTDAGDGTIIAGEAPFAFTYADPPTNEFFYASAVYRNTDLFGGSLNILGYTSESEFLNPGSDIRAALQRNGGPFPNAWPGLFQTGRVTEETGFRADYTKRLSDRIRLTVGTDYNDAESDSLMPISTEEGFDETLFFDAAILETQTPPFTLQSLGLFADATLDLTDKLSVTGGIRWDDFEYEVIGPYNVVFTFAPGARPGGSGQTDGTSINAGASYDLNADNLLFVNYSQGFTIPTLGFIGNNVPPGVSVSDSEFIAPVETDSIEAGLRGAAGRFQYAGAVYFSQSEFSQTVAVDPSTGLAIRDRVPVENWGVEFSGAWDITDAIRVDGTFTYVNGEIDPNDDGSFIAQSTQFVPPIKITINPSWQVTPDISVFGQVFYSGEREDGFEDGTDANPAEAFTLVDAGANWQISNFVLSAQVTNLFNEAYIPPGEATFIPGRILSGPGRALSLSVQYEF